MRKGMCEYVCGNCYFLHLNLANGNIQILFALTFIIGL